MRGLKAIPVAVDPIRGPSPELSTLNSTPCSRQGIAAVWYILRRFLSQLGATGFFGSDLPATQD